MSYHPNTSALSLTRGMFSLIIVRTLKLMKTEKIVISAIAVVVGIIVAGALFYFYQQTKTIPQNQTKVISVVAPSPMQKPSIFLSVEKPTDEEVVDTKIITVSGKTDPGAIIVITTDAEDQIINPAQNGNFSSSISIDSGSNKIIITAIAKNGEEAKVIRTVTYSTENF